MPETAPEQQDPAPSAPVSDDDQRLRLPDWMLTASPEAPPRPFRDWMQDHGLKTLALAIVGAIFVPFGMMIWDVWTAPPGTPSYLSQVNAFAGTEAARYREGIAGIVPPEPRPTATFTADEVGAALESVRRVLAAARLDPAMVSDRDPSAFLALLSPANRSLLRADFTARSAPYYATQAHGRVPLAKIEPRADGEMTYQEISVDGSPRLEVTTSYTWVYAFDTSNVAAGRHLVTVTDDLVWHVVPETAADVPSRGVHLHDGAAAAENVACEPFRDGRISPATGSAVKFCR